MTAPRKNAQAITNDVPRPSSAPSSGPAVVCVVWAFAHRNSAVSRPSRPTASMATTNTAPAPAAIAPSSLDCSSARMKRAVRAIQKIIHVTSTTARIDRTPPIASCASKLRPLGPNVSRAPKATETPAAAATPAHSGGRRSRRSVLTR